MPNQKLIDYIKENKKAGFSNEDIKKNLLREGWSEEDIEKELKSFEETSQMSPVSPKAPKVEETFQPEKEIKKAKPPTTLISIVFLIAGIGHLASIPILLLFSLASWSFTMMAIFSVISLFCFLPPVLLYG
ncbi:MAG: hypothetical protein GF387_00620, partial [Candidatus Portnoybacteria bacterium]|nr:hypothetical protein [Candidatus Portnoybacteria bacterium]